MMVAQNRKFERLDSDGVGAELMKTRLPLGFTFSYPLEQHYIDHGKLKTWTKGFDIKGVEGEDIAEQFRKSLEARVSYQTHSPLSCVSLT